MKSLPSRSHCSLSLSGEHVWRVWAGEAGEVSLLTLPAPSRKFSFNGQRTAFLYVLVAASLSDQHQQPQRILVACLGAWSVWELKLQPDCIPPKAISGRNEWLKQSHNLLSLWGGRNFSQECKVCRGLCAYITTNSTHTQIHTSTLLTHLLRWR